ncbi:hypothetical protein [Halobacillus sp. K22]|uniref:hypothetical protein n=1 Tax=Halobacillus sp. K22 TaxID=3457431 RepID=UPI003FCCE89A
MNLIGWMIVFCEIGFWIVILLGLVTRYVFRKEKLGLIFLALTPVIDLILLITTGIDLYLGATATIAHAIAAVYIGVSVAFGKSMIEWADVRFRYYIMREGPPPEKLAGMAHATQYLKGWGRHVLAYLIGSLFLVSLIYMINDPSRTAALSDTLRLWSLVLGVDLLIAVSHFVWPKKAKG